MHLAIFHAYDQAALDAQYNQRALVPDFARHFQRWAASSEAARHSRPCRLGLAYGGTPEEALDFFPAARPRAPLLVFIHGGYWQAMDKSDFSFIAPSFQAAGIAVAVINYALAPRVGIDEIVRQCRAAVAWLWRSAAQLGIDPQRLHVAGHSAGGHLAAMVMAMPVSAFALPSHPVRGICGVSGLYDLEPIRLSYLNATLGMDGETARRNSPFHLSPPAGGSVILALGSRETDEFHRQQAVLAEAWRERGCAVAEMELADANHFTVLDGLADPQDPLFRAAAMQILGLEKKPWEKD